MKGLLVIHSDENGNAKATQVPHAAIPDFAAKAVKAINNDMIHCVVEEDSEEGLKFYDENGEQLSIETIAER